MRYLLQKLDLVSGVLRGLGTATYSAVQPPFRGTSGAATYRKHVIFAVIRTLFTRLSPEQLQLIVGTSKEGYLGFAKQKCFAPNVVAIRNGAEAFWIGDPSAERVVMWIHGGGFTLPLDSGAMSPASELTDLFGIKDKQAALFLPSYSMAFQAHYPHQLTQIVEALRYLTVDLDKKPSNIIIGGDSAGAGLALGLIPWVSFEGSADSFSRNKYKDLVSTGFLTPWKEKYSASGVVEDVLIVAGEDEVFMDDVKMLGKKMKSAPTKTTTVIAAHGFHIEPILAPSFGIEEGEYVRVVKAWVKARANV